MSEENGDKLNDFAKETFESFYSQEKVEALISATVDAAESLGLNILEVHGACSALKSCCESSMIANYAEAVGLDYDAAEERLNF